MSFKIIDGGNDKTPKENIEQLKVFVSHMRALENSISSIKTLAADIKWDELNIKLTSCHDQILDTLAYVKNSTKTKIEEKNTNNKKPKNYLKLLD